MDFFLNRYRNLTALLLALLAQLALLSYQVKSNQEVRLIRVWAVTAVTPLARVLEAVRGLAAHGVDDYLLLVGVRQENLRMKADLDRVSMENQFLRTELNTAERARELALFQASSPSKYVASHVIGNSTGSGGRVVIVDRGATSGIQSGMAVITPAGIVGKVIRVYPTAAFVRLATDPAFAAGVVSQKNHVRGTLKGQGESTLSVDEVQNEDNLETGEWFFTSGDDLIFPKGLPVGTVASARPGKGHKEVVLTPSGFRNGLEEVLIVVEGVHALVPPAENATQPVHMQPAPPVEDGASPANSGPAVSAVPPGSPLTTDADRLLDQYRHIGEAQKHVYGERGAGPPNYNAAPAAGSAQPAEHP